MQDKPVIDLKRIRRIKNGFSFIPHRFLGEGFFKSLDHSQLILYFFLALAADRFGMSWYGDPSLIKFTQLDQNQLDEARNGLMKKALIAVELPFIQVLELPGKPVEETGTTGSNPSSSPFSFSQLSHSLRD